MTNPQGPQGVLPGGQEPNPEVRSKARDLADGEWHRLHPATPLLRGGLALIIFVGIVVSTFRDRLIGLVVPDEFEYGSRGEEEFANFFLDQIAWFALGTVGVVLLAVVGFWLSWRVHRFRVTADAVEVRQGILVRKQRRAPLARIQGINLQKPWFARLLGACKLEIQQAGSDANVELDYLSTPIADALRFEILRRASGRSAQDAAALAAERGVAQDGGGNRVIDDFLRPDAEIAHVAPHSLVRIDMGRVVLSSLLDGSVVFSFLLIVGVVVGTLVFQQWWLVFAMLPGAIALVSVGIKSISTKLRYSIAATPDGIRLAYGLASTTTEILPPGRIFAVQVTQPLLWRPFGWWQVRFTRIGKKPSSGSGSSSGGGNAQLVSYLLPVGTIEDVRTVVGLVVPQLAGDPAVVQGLFGKGRGDAAGDAFVTSPPRAALFDWWSAKRNGFLVRPAAFLLRSGRIWRRLAIVPQARVQSIAMQQGPFAGSMRLARVLFHVPGTVLAPSVGNLEARDAMALFEEAPRTVKMAIDADASESWAAQISRSEVLEHAPTVQAGAVAVSAVRQEAAGLQPSTHRTTQHEREPERAVPPQAPLVAPPVPPPAPPMPPADGAR